MSMLHLGTEDDGYDGLNGRFNSLHNILFLKDDYSPSVALLSTLYEPL